MRLLLFLTTFSQIEAQGRFSGESKQAFRRRVKNDPTVSRKEPFGGWRNFQRDNTRKESQALCSARGNGQAEQCCDNIDIECLGCNPSLSKIGIVSRIFKYPISRNFKPCNEQTTEADQLLRRDCFCDSSCILFDDCCEDHKQTCDHLYDPTTPTPPTEPPTTSTTSTTTTSTS